MLTRDLPLRLLAYPPLNLEALHEQVLKAGRRSASQSVAGDKSTPASPSVASIGSTVVQKNDTNPLPETQATSTTAPINEIVREPSPPPASAVSRFLGRFSSRPKTSSMDSIALSQDDLEFLSDVPSLTSPEVDQDTGLDALSSMIRSPPLPQHYLLPLPPPPRLLQKLPYLLRRLAASHRITTSCRSSMTLTATLKLPFNLNRHSHYWLQCPRHLSSQWYLPIPPRLPPVASFSIPTVRVGSPEQQPDQSWPSFDYPSTPMNKPLPLRQVNGPSCQSCRLLQDHRRRLPPLLPGPGSITPLSPPPTSRRGSGAVDLLSGTSAGIASLPSTSCFPLTHASSKCPTNSTHFSACQHR